MKCENSCGTDLSGRQQRFCSDKCRKQSLRAATKRKSDKLGRSNSDNNLSAYKDGADSLDTFHERFIDGGGKDNCLARATSNQLYSAINSYPQDTWKNSPEFKELMKRLHSMSVEELEAGGYDVPCWKYSEAA